MDRLSASEAVYAVLAWLTTRPIPVVISSEHDAADIAQLAEQFSRHQQFAAPRDGWDKWVNPMPNPPEDDRDSILMKWDAAKRALDVSKEYEMTVRKQAFAIGFGANAKEGVNTVDLGGGYKLKGTRKVNYTLDTDVDKVEAALTKLEKMGAEGKFIADRLVRWKAELSITEYKKLDEKYRKVIDTVITTKDGAPVLEIKAPKAAK